MNTREIAQSVGKDERSVRRWINKASDKMSGIADKMSGSSSTHPADYTRDEVLAIIETGLGKNAAAIWRTNSELSSVPATSSDIDSRLDRLERIVGIIAENSYALSTYLVEQKVKPGITTGNNLLTRELPSSSGCNTDDERVTSLHAIKSRISRSLYNNDYAEAWRYIYASYDYRFRATIQRDAQMYGYTTVLSYARDRGLLEDLLRVAMSL